MAFDTFRITFQTFSVTDFEALYAIFYESVHGIALESPFYTKKQCDAWAPADFDHYYWTIRLKKLTTIFAIAADKKVGFIAYRNDGYIDFLYVLPEFKGKGIAQELFNYAEFDLLSKVHIHRLSTDASYLAKPFFERNGFSVVKKNEIPLRGEVLINFSMEKNMILIG